MEKPYRPCVVAVIMNDKGQVLAGERSDQANAWQLPQGGVDEGETADQAVYRELLEEIGTDRVREISRLPEIIRYDFPKEMAREQLKKFRGQEQVWFLFRFQDGIQWDLNRADGEFSRVQWMEPSQLVEGIIEWKREAYRKGLKGFGILA